MEFRSAILIGIVLYTAALQGCATIVQGRTQKIGVSSTPLGAEVVIDGQQRFMTPASVELERDKSHTFVFQKEGYQEDSFVITSGTSGWVWGNILAGGIIGGLVDFSTGAARKLSQDSVHVSLAPLPASTESAPVAAEESTGPQTAESKENEAN